jgi:hypothetical protein
VCDQEKKIVQHSQRKAAAMQLVEQHVIKRGDPRYAVIDAAAFASKNLYGVEWGSYERRK